MEGFVEVASELRDVPVLIARPGVGGRRLQVRIVSVALTLRKRLVVFRDEAVLEMSKQSLKKFHYKNRQQGSRLFYLSQTWSYNCETFQIFFCNQILSLSKP